MNPLSVLSQCIHLLRPEKERGEEQNALIKTRRHNVLSIRWHHNALSTKTVPINVLVKRLAHLNIRFIYIKKGKTTVKKSS